MNGSKIFARDTLGPDSNTLEQFVGCLQARCQLLGIDLGIRKERICQLQPITINKRKEAIFFLRLRFLCMIPAPKFFLLACILNLKLQQQTLTSLSKVSRCLGKYSTK